MLFVLPFRDPIDGSIDSLHESIDSIQVIYQPLPKALKLVINAPEIHLGITSDVLDFSRQTDDF